MKPDPEKVIADYLAAFSDANPVALDPPRIKYERGWYRFRGQPACYPRYRRSELEEMTKRLRERADRTVNGP